MDQPLLVLVSALDTYPDTTSGNLCAHTCEAMLQGTNRLQRGINYVDDLRKLSGSVDHPLGFFSGGLDCSDTYIKWVYGPG